jgi:cytoskeletal protein CcmA (bactofilin family)
MSNEKSAVGGKRTLVEEGTEFKGSLSSNCPVEVKGSVDGQLSAPSLTVSSTGSVRGKVKVAELRSEGELAGEFDAEVVKLSGSVKDNTVIRAKSLEVKIASAKGAIQVIFGDCELDIGTDAAKEAVAEPAEQAAAPTEEAAAPDNESPARPRRRRDGNAGSVPPGPMENSN